jgi:hypothetical protein
MAAVQEREERLAPGTDSLQRTANTKIAACGYQSFLKRVNRVLCPAALLVDLREIQIELGVIVPHPKGFLAQHFPIAVALFGNGCKESCIGEIEGVLGSYAQSATSVEERLVCVPIP